MDGFFTQKQTQSATRPDGKLRTCVACGLYKHAHTPKMKPQGKFQKGIMIIGGVLNEVEDKRGKPWQSAAGRLLVKTFNDLGVDVWEDCLSVNAVCCYPGQGKIDNNELAPNCRNTIFKLIARHKPNVIILLGNLPLISVIGGRWKRDLDDIHKWRGWVIPDRDLDAWVCPVYGPEEVESKKELKTIWRQDLKRIFSHLRKPLLKWNEPLIDFTGDPARVLHHLKRIKCDLIAFDYETTGVKPHGPGHRIVCASVAYNEYSAFSFLFPATRKELKPFMELLGDESIGKMAHNIKFEENWSVQRLRQPVKNWKWDSMLAAHTLDNRPGITSLKFQTYVQFGIVDYDSGVSPYLKSASRDGNGVNNIFELIKTPSGVEQLLKYCGWDAVLEYRLAQYQQKQIGV